MESPQLLGTDVERCRECRGHVTRVGGEFVCTSCGLVTRKEEYVAELTASPTAVSREFGMGPLRRRGP
jgi:hypothetical protein